MPSDTPSLADSPQSILAMAVVTKCSECAGSRSLLAMETPARCSSNNYASYKRPCKGSFAKSESSSSSANDCGLVVGVVSFTRLRWQLKVCDASCIAAGNPSRSFLLWKLITAIRKARFTGASHIFVAGIVREMLRRSRPTDISSLHRSANSALSREPPINKQSIGSCPNKFTTLIALSDDKRREIIKKKDKRALLGNPQIRVTSKETRSVLVAG